MPDICMCSARTQNNKVCPYCYTCYRFKAKPSERQSWFVYGPYDHKTQSCEYYWKNKDGEKNSN